MSYYSPLSQWPAGFVIAFKEFITQQIRFSSISISPNDSVIQNVNFSNYVSIDIRVDGGKQNDND